MASKTIGGKIVLEGEAEYRAALKNITTQQKELRSEMTLCTSEFKENQNSMDALEKKHEILTKQIETQTKKVELYADALEKSRQKQEESGKKVEDLKTQLSSAESEMAQMAKATDVSAEAMAQQGKEVEELKRQLSLAEQEYNKTTQATSGYQTTLNNAQADLNNMNRSLEQNDFYMEEAKNSTDGCATSIDQFGKKSKEAGDEAEQAGDKSAEAFQALAGVLASSGITKAVGEIAEALMDCNEVADEFGWSIAKMETLADTSSEAWGTTKTDIMELSAEYGKSATSIADAGYQALSAGVAIEKTAGFLEQSLQLAIGGYTESATAVDILTTSINAYHRSAEDAQEISDQLIMTQNLGKTTVNDLAQNMGTVIPTAAAYNVELDNLCTSYAILTKNGTNTANSTTQLNGMFTELADSGSKVAGILMSQTGQSFSELMKNGRSLGDVLNILYESADRDTTAFANLWSNTRASRAALNIAQTGVEEFNATLNKMNNSAGAVSKAYNIMAKESVSVEARMTESCNALKIAIGDELSPALDRLQETGADCFDWATDFVKENPEIVDAVAALTIGLTVLGAGVTVLTVIQLPAFKAAIDAVTASMAANPIGAVIVGITALSAALVTAIALMDDETESMKEQAQACRENVKANQESIEAINSTIETNKAQALSLQTLADRVTELSEKEHLTTQEQNELQVSVAALNEAFPELGLEIDKTTGKLIGNTDAITKNISALMKMYTVEAMQKSLTELADKNTDAIMAEIEASEGLAEAKEHLAELEEEYAENQKEAMESGIAYAMAYQQQNIAVNVLISQIAEAKRTVNDFEEAEKEAQDQQSELAAEFEQINGVIDQQTAEYNRLIMSTDGATESTIEFAGKLYDITNASDEVVSAIGTLQTAYNDAKAEAQDSISTQVGLFDELSTASDLTVEQMAKNLKSQTDTYSQYSTDLQTASELMKQDTTGNFSTVLQSIMDMGVSGAGYLHELVTAAEDSSADFEEVMKNYASMESAKEQLASTMADIKTDYSDSMDELLSKTDSGYSAISTTILAQAPEVASASKTLADESKNAMSLSLGMTDDGKSEVFLGMGTSIPDSMAAGIMNGQSAVSGAIQAVIDNAVANADLSGITDKIDRALGEAIS